MSLSLRDQLLQAGLISKKQAEKAQAATGKDKPRGQHNHGKQITAQAPNAEALKAAEAARKAKAAKDRELMDKAKEKQALKAKYAEIKQLVEANKLPPVVSEDLYNFVDHKNNIRRIAVTPELRAQIIDGRVGIARCEGRYSLVPGAVADKIRERDPRAVATINREADKVDENDPYKDFKVPDDLIW
ncbi:DUF2058 domain-containing protein [Nevskia ramosa]|uniref:DUF2058 domain-containing protein n=1 Tax=Nevskia ramosa TaxID=64002 RepID=UPI003D0E4237